MPLLLKTNQENLSTIKICNGEFSETVKSLIQAEAIKETTGEKFLATSVCSGVIVHSLCGYISSDATTEELRVALGDFIRVFFKKKISQFCITFEGFSDDVIKSLVELLGEVLELSCYTFDKYKTNEPQVLEPTVYVECRLSSDEFSSLAQKGQHIADGAVIARNLANEPADILNPDSFATLAEEYAKAFGFSFEKMTKADLKEQGFGLHLAVGAGSVNPPCLVKLKYTGTSLSTPYTALVGKGVTFDSGGYCLKSGGMMYKMKSDMSGAAAVLGAMCSIAKNKLQANVLALIPLSENLIGRDAYLPGVVLKSRSGKTVEITNTDAEGRLLLADSLDYVSTMDEVSDVIDIATLTGSSVATFGGVYSACLTNSSTLYSNIEEIGRSCGEFIWQLPLHNNYKHLLKSPIADFSNSSGVPMAGAISAGMFLKEFVGEKTWAHIDMAGVGNSKKDTGYTPEGSTGYGARLFYYYIKSKQN